MTTVSTDTARISNLVKHELWPETGFCRKAVVANEASAKTYGVGTVLGKYVASPAGAAVAGGSNTGNGTMGAITVTSNKNLQLGVYTLRIVEAAANAGNFIVTDPAGDVVGFGTVAVAFSQGGLAFTLADGSTDFVVGDTFAITVSGTVKYKIAVQTAVDGSEFAAALVIDDYSVPATTNTTVLVLIKGPAEVSQGALVLDASYDLDAEKAVVYASLEALDINMLTTV